MDSSYSRRGVPGPAQGGYADMPLPGGRYLPLSQCSDRGPLVMGILNLTPDSFSDGGSYRSVESAVERGLQMLDEGADLLDLGAESTRPASQAYGAGAPSIQVEEEERRLLPVLEGLRSVSDAPLSIDTRKAQVAKSALAAGADIINDVTALSDPEMAAVAAEANVPIVLMHLRGTLPDIQQHANYGDVLAEVHDELAAVVDRALASGIDRDQILLDPGIGFAKQSRHNLTLLRHLDRIVALGHPLLVGASRKRFIGDLTDTVASDRTAGSLATVAWAAQKGATIVRVHDVLETRHFIDVYQAIEHAHSSARPGSVAT